jgi:hypothetical protein
LETDNKTVWRYLDKMPPRENYAGEICRVKNTGAENRLTHIKAIKAYEAMDAGFTRAEICEYAGISSDVLVVARDRKEELEKVYVSAIKTIFDASDHDKPYVTPKLRQKLKV